MSDKTEDLRASHLLWLTFISHYIYKSLCISNHWWNQFSQHCPADWVGPADCCPPMPVFIFNFGSGSASVFLFLNWRPPTLPHRLQCSTIGRSGLNHRVRDGNGCCPWTHRHQKARVLSEVFPSFRTKLCSSVSARSFRAVSPKNFLFDSPWQLNNRQQLST